RAAVAQPSHAAASSGAAAAARAAVPRLQHPPRRAVSPRLRRGRRRWRGMRSGMVPRVRLALSQTMPKLFFPDSSMVQQSIDLGVDPVLIGRAVECQVRTQDAMVSRRHARIVWEGGGYWIEDLGSSNGVQLGGERITRRVPLRPGDEVRCGSLLLRLLADR